MPGIWENLNAKVTSAWSDLGEIPNCGEESLFNVEIENDGEVELDDFTIQSQDAHGGEWYTHRSLEAILGAAMPALSDPTLLSAGAKVHLSVPFEAAFAIRFRAKTAYEETAVSVRGTYSDANVCHALSAAQALIAAYFGGDPVTCAQVTGLFEQLMGGGSDYTTLFDLLTALLNLGNPAQEGEAADAAAAIIVAMKLAMSGLATAANQTALNTLLTPLATANNPGAAVSVTNASATLLTANASRRSAIIVNRSLTAMLTVKLGSTAVSGSGITLAPAADATHPGGSCVIDDYTGIITGIMSAADATVGNVSVSET
jgi:hypothetical protein